MNLTQAFRIMFYFLDDVYFSKPNGTEKIDFDSLGSLLGDMNWDIFDSFTPADVAVYEDWCSVAKKINKNKDLTSSDAVKIMKAFFELNIEEFGYFWLYDIINYIDHIDIYDTFAKIENACYRDLEDFDREFKIKTISKTHNQSTNFTL